MSRAPVAGDLLWWFNGALSARMQISLWELLTVVGVDECTGLVSLRNGAGREQLGRAADIERQVSYQYTSPAELIPASSMDARGIGVQEEVAVAT